MAFFVTSLYITGGTGCGTANEASFDGSPNLSNVRIGDIFFDEARNRFLITGINDVTDILSFTGSCTEDGTNDAFVHRNGLVVPSGNVGIGTNSPSTKLEISEDANNFVRLNPAAGVGSSTYRFEGYNSANSTLLPLT